MSAVGIGVAVFLIWMYYGTLPSTASGATLPLTMPRQPRLDAPNTLHHVMVRGLERRTIFKDDADCADFVARLADRAEQGCRPQ